MSIKVPLLPSKLLDLLHNRFTSDVFKKSVTALSLAAVQNLPPSLRQKLYRDSSMEIKDKLKSNLMSGLPERQCFTPTTPSINDRSSWM